MPEFKELGSGVLSQWYRVQSAKVQSPSVLSLCLCVSFVSQCLSLYLSLFVFVSILDIYVSITLYAFFCLCKCLFSSLCERAIRTGDQDRQSGQAMGMIWMGGIGMGNQDG